jgi:hypothetical protein
MQRIREFTKVLDREHLERQHRYELGKASQIEFIRNFVPDGQKLSQETKAKINLLKGQIEAEMRMSEKVPEWFEILNMELVRKKVLFKQYFADNSHVREIALDDAEFNQQLSKSNHATKAFINGVLKQVQQNEEQKDVLEFQKDEDVWR